MLSNLSPGDETHRALGGKVLVDFESVKFRKFAGHMEEELEKLIERWRHLAAPAASARKKDQFGR